MAITYVFAGIATAHYASALPWYGRLFGRPPEMLPQDEEAAWQLTDTGWIYHGTVGRISRPTGDPGRYTPSR